MVELQKFQTSLMIQDRQQLSCKLVTNWQIETAGYILLVRRELGNNDITSIRATDFQGFVNLERL